MSPETQESAPKEVNKGVKETLEIIEGLKVCVPAVVEIVADRKLTFHDFKPAQDALRRYDTVVIAVDNAKEAIPEIKDLAELKPEDLMELALIGKASMELIKLIHEAHARGKRA